MIPGDPNKMPTNSKTFLKSSEFIVGVSTLAANQMTQARANVGGALNADQ